MSAKSIVIASDHAGYELKQVLGEDLAGMGFDVIDLGTDGGDSVDYPDFAFKLTTAIKAGRAALGVLICGSGIGISIAANRDPEIRAAPCQDTLTARLARQHNDANVLALGARLVGESDAKEILRVFLETEFEGGRHARRVAKLGAGLPEMQQADV